MTLQQWLFSFKGRIGRRDFWIWIVLWTLAMVLLFVLVDRGLLSSQNAAFLLVCLLWPTAAVVVKRLHDRGKSGLWALTIILAWMLFAGNGSMLPDSIMWTVRALIPAAIIALLVLDLGALSGNIGGNKYGIESVRVKFR